MTVIKIDKKDWANGLEKSRQLYRLLGPYREQNDDMAVFAPLAEGQIPDMTASDTVLSPKSIVYPQSEVMFEYTTDDSSPDCNLLKRPEKDYTACAVIGIRPYDAAAFLLMKKNFDTADYRDPYWCDAYEACTFIGLAVNEPDPTDFSPSVGSGPFSEKGLDVLLVDIGEAFLAKIVTERGSAYLKAAGWDTPADQVTARDRIQVLKEAAEAKILTDIHFENIHKCDLIDLYNADFWEDTAFACINCGTCTYLCPTCWCFDIQDESHGKSGKRYKNWDSCMYPLFTLHASGHNPRADSTMRVRQRFMHKLKYFLDKYNDGVMCVGCGRCVRSCPVNIDIREVCRRMNAYDTESCSCAAS